MSMRRIEFAIAALGCLLIAGCHAPGAPGPVEPRPDQVMEFNTLYKENCAACHGEKGHKGLAVSLANPVYIPVAGKDVIRKYTAEGGPGKLMPAFARSSGGILTDKQVDVLVEGIIHDWSKQGALGGVTPPSYAATLEGDPAAGKEAFNSFCVRCHSVNATDTHKVAGVLTEPSYLALTSDQGLRSTIITGRPDDGMPDWRGYAAQPLTDKQVTDIVAWLASQRKSYKATMAEKQQAAAKIAEPNKSMNPSQSANKGETR